jgi:hypothetical protein
MRMVDCRTARQAVEWNPQGKRKRKRPVNTWKDGIRGQHVKKKPQGWRMFQLRALEGEKKNFRCVFTEKFIYIYIL